MAELALQKWLEDPAAIRILWPGSKTPPVTRTEAEFDPDQENKELLEKWLEFRGASFAPGQDVKDLRALAKFELAGKGNVPAFAEFSDFDPSQASESFLRNWLSWYGITAPEKDEKKEWWIEKTRELLGILKKRPKQDLQETFQDLRRLGQVRENLSPNFMEALQALEPQDLDLLSSIAQKNKTSSQRGRTTVGGLGQERGVVGGREEKKSLWDRKRLLALAMDASAVAVPFLVPVVLTNSQRAFLGETLLSHRANPEDKSILTALGSQTRAAVHKRALEAVVGHVVGRDEAAQLVGDLVTGLRHKGKGTRLPQKRLERLASKYFKSNPELVWALQSIFIPVLSGRTFLERASPREDEKKVDIDKEIKAAQQKLQALEQQKQKALEEKKM